MPRGRSAASCRSLRSLVTESEPGSRRHALLSANWAVSHRSAVRPRTQGSPESDGLPGRPTSGPPPVATNSRLRGLRVQVDLVVPRVCDLPQRDYRNGWPAHALVNLMSCTRRSPPNCLYGLDAVPVAVVVGRDGVRIVERDSGRFLATQQACMQAGLSVLGRRRSAPETMSTGQPYLFCPYSHPIDIGDWISAPVGSILLGVVRSSAMVAVSVGFDRLPRYGRPFPRDPCVRGPRDPSGPRPPLGSARGAVPEAVLARRGTSMNRATI
jgi:hypothetical protein